MRPDARLRSPTQRLACAAAALVLAAPAGASLASRAKEAGCIDAPQVLSGTNVYKCNTASGAPAMFNVPETVSQGDRPVRRPANTTTPGAAPPAPAAPTVTGPGLPRVDAATQKGRDDLRRRVLQDELAAEEKLLAETRTAYANGSPPALPEERTQPQRYAERVSRLRDALLRHERNIEMLRRELAIR
jgi:hypothetical protein